MLDFRQVETMADAVSDVVVVTDQRLSKLVELCDRLPPGKAALLKLAITRFESRNFRACLNILLPEFEFLLR